MTSPIPTCLVPSVAPSDSTPREVARRFRGLLDSGARLLPAGEAKDDPAGLLSAGYTPKYELSLFDTRFFLTNVANARTFNVTFGGAKVKIVASDVGRFEREQWIESVVIAPAERYVVDVRFDEPGEVAIANTIQAINHFRGEFYPHTDINRANGAAAEAA